MTINPIPLDDFPRTGRPWNNITPFTYRDGLTYLEVLEALRAWVRDVLTAHLNDEMEEFAENWNQVLNDFQVAVIESFDQKMEEFDVDVQAFKDAVNAQFDQLRKSLESDIANQLTTVNDALAAWDETYATFTANIQALVDQWTSVQIENNDIITSQILEDEDSLTTNAVLTLAKSVVPSVDLRDFGAVGDGVADDTVSTQSFFDYLTANGGVGTGTGTFRLTASIIVADGGNFTFNGSGVGATKFVSDKAVSGNVFTVRQVHDAVFRNFSISGTDVATTSHGISAFSCQSVSLEDFRVSEYSGTAALFFKHESFEGLSTENRIVRGVARGGGESANGFLIESSTDSEIVDSYVYDLSLTASPSYGLQLKNDCTGCRIIGGGVDGAKAGVAFGYDSASEGSQTLNNVSGVTVKNAVHGFTGSWAESNNISVIVDMSNVICERGLSVQGHMNNNHIEAVIVSPNSDAVVAYVQDDNNRVDILSVNTLGSATIAEFAATANKNVVRVGQVGDKSALGAVASNVTDNGTDNRVVFDVNEYERYATPEGTSVLRFPRAGSVSNWIQYSHGFQQFSLRSNNVVSLIVGADATLPGLQSTQTLGNAGRRWESIHVNGIVLYDTNNAAYSVTVGTDGTLTTTPL